MQCYKLTWMSTARVKSGSEVPCKPVDSLLFNASTIVTVGDGMKTQFWHHSWLDGEAPKNLALHLFELARRKNKSMQQELYTHSWIRALRGRITTATHVEEFVSLWIRLQNVQLQLEEQDSIVWKWTPDGKYSTRSAYQIQF